jgi:hypothetical protein
VYLLNLTLAQFAAVFGSVAAVSVALYLLDRTRRQQVVSTLHFWVAATQPQAVARRRRIQQPWSLALQLAGMALLLLAVAQLRWGTPAAAGRDHVILLETSAWMGARTGGRTLMDLARERARRYLRALPSQDRVMLVRADGLATPATAFEPDRRKVEAAILASRPGFTALNLDQALLFARHIQSQEGRRAGEIVFVGTGRTAGSDAAGVAAAPHNLRVLAVPDAIENCGLRKVGMRRSATDAASWDVYVSAHNYGATPRTAIVSLEFRPSGAPQGLSFRIAGGSRRIALPPGGDAEASFEFPTRAAGVLRATLTPHDDVPADDRADLEVPAQPVLPVVVYSNAPELLRPLLNNDPRVAATYRKPEEYRAGDRGLVILDRFIPPEPPAADSVWIEPPSPGSPVAVRQTVEQAAFARWNDAHPIAAGLHARDFKLERTQIFEAGRDDARIGEVREGPVIVARSGSRKTVVFGFHPALSALRYELAAPLLFANLLRWVSPEVFRRWEIAGSSVGTVKAELDQDAEGKEVKVISGDGSPLPFTLRDRALHFFAGTPGSVRVTAGDREYVYSLTLPELWDAKWQPPAEARQGVPRFRMAAGASSDLWPWLALAGAVCLLVEWLLYGRNRRGARRFLAPLGPIRIGPAFRRRTRQPLGVRR